ncbi:hypothetical protein [Aliiruegeria lutimaris]|uniref:HEAT repeat domain-containing protein n=1 Tax=Aliiruegeria lutimaris TaxID=571298 RepID=A0A1G8M7B9_9RHOB|nr:hypothetical protein [Aliiruegeria lutimaris]SDI63785.1 hypothetical protein SAMN04488026_100542 [Aliiruegeria lutimaris]
MKRGIAALVALAIGYSSSVHACSFHTYLPEMTVIDRLMMTENVVLARPAAGDPFRFEAVEALEGTLEQADLPTLVDSSTRRRLAANPEDAVLFARDGGGYGPFMRLAYVDSGYRALLEEVMARKEDWIMGDDLARYQFFADRLESEDQAIRGLALRELDRAPYDIFQQLDMAPAAAPILQELWQIDQIPFVPIRILLLGRSGDAAAQESVIAGLERAKKDGGRYLGPLAVALIELDGAGGVDRLVADYLSGQNDPGATESVVEALAIQAGAGDEALRTYILETLRGFVHAFPQHADAVARQFVLRYDYAMAEPLREVMTAGKIKSATDLIPVAAYVATSGEFSGAFGAVSE